MLEGKVLCCVVHSLVQNMMPTYSLCRLHMYRCVCVCAVLQQRTKSLLLAKSWRREGVKWQNIVIFMTRFFEKKKNRILFSFLFFFFVTIVGCLADVAEWRYLLKWYTLTAADVCETFSYKISTCKQKTGTNLTDM